MTDKDKQSPNPLAALAIVIVGGALVLLFVLSADQRADKSDALRAEQAERQAEQAARIDAEWQRER